MASIENLDPKVLSGIAAKAEAEKKAASVEATRFNNLSSSEIQAEFERLKAFTPTAYEDLTVQEKLANPDYRTMLQQHKSTVDSLSNNPEDAANDLRNLYNLTNRFRSGEEASSASDPISRDIRKGIGFADIVVGEKGLGRLGEDDRVKELIQRQQDIADKGLSREELSQKRAELFGNIDSANQTALRGLKAAQAQAGVRGATAGQQLLQGALAGARQKSDVSRNLFLQSEELQRQGLKDLTNLELQTRQFDLGQAAAEKSLQLTSGFGFAELGSAERSAATMSKIAENDAKNKPVVIQQGCHVAGTKVKLRDGSSKNIEDLVLGDTLAIGGEVQGVGQLKSEEQFFKYKDAICTASHIVYENDKFIHVKDSKIAVFTGTTGGIVYPIKTENGVYVTIDDTINGDIFSEEGFICKSEGTNQKIMRLLKSGFQHILGMLGLKKPYRRTLTLSEKEII